MAFLAKKNKDGVHITLALLPVRNQSVNGILQTDSHARRDLKKTHVRFRIHVIHLSEAFELIRLI